MFSGERQNDCPNEITLAGTEEEKSHLDRTENLDTQIVIGFLGGFVFVLIIIAGIQFRK